MKEEQSLNSIGEELIACRLPCKGIKNAPEDGIYPRCVYLEKGNEKSSRFDCIVIGLNPGTASPLEMAFTRYIREQKGCIEFDDIKTVAKPIVENHDYYIRVRGLLRKYFRKRNLNILWTELVKCQSMLDDTGNKLPLEASTKNRCFQKFLKRELGIFTKQPKPLLILLGNEIENFIKKCGKGHSIGFEYLKLYHPTGSRRFHSYFENKDIKNGKLIRSKLEEKTFK